MRRRIRIHPVEYNPTADQRETADRAARREFTLLHAPDYPGILRPVEFTEGERGPALMFDLDPTSGRCTVGWPNLRWPSGSRWRAAWR